MFGFLIWNNYTIFSNNDKLDKLEKLLPLQYFEHVVLQFILRFRISMDGPKLSHLVDLSLDSCLFLVCFMVSRITNIL